MRPLDLRSGSPRVKAIQALVCAVLLAAIPFASTRAARSRDATPPQPCTSTGTAPYLHTCGPFIEDAAGHAVRLLAVNWYGFEANDFVAAGLDQQPYRAIITMVKNLGFNALRIPFSNEMVETNPIVSNLTQTCPAGEPQTACRPVDGQQILAANPDLVGLTSLQILKAIVDYAGSQGLYVILDDHRSRAGWSAQENGLWYDDAHGYPQSSWLTDWEHIGTLFANDPALTGVDLFNEPHSFNHPTDCASYLSGHGASWGACSGQSNPATDWRAAATLAGDALLSIDPNLLIVVEGTSMAPDSSGGLDASEYGTSLAAAGSQPVTLNVPGRLVYSVHEYAWHQGGPTDVATLLSRWTRLFGYLMNPAASYATPVWIGEFGTCNTRPTCVLDTVPGHAGYWFDALIRYFNTPPYPGAPPFGWSLWALDGTSPDAYDFIQHAWARRNGDPEPYGLLNTAWSDQSLPDLQGELFNEDQFAALPTAPATLTPSTPVASPTPGPSPSATPPTTGTTGSAAGLPAPALGVRADGLFAHGRVRFDLLAGAGPRAGLAGYLRYADSAHRLAIQGQSIDGVSLRCGARPQVVVTGTARDGSGRHYAFSMQVDAAGTDQMRFALRLSSGYTLSGVAAGRATFSC